MSTHLYLGFDPGGETERNFGWCLAKGNKKPRLTIIDHGIAKYAKDAVDKALAAVQKVKMKMSATGIDAPLFWRPDGDRNVDNILRKMVIKCGGRNGTVNPVNSLRGACLVQGMMTAMLLRNTWPKLRLTESHPKAMLWILGIICDKPPLKKITLSNLDQFFIGENLNGASEHERDAALGALSAWAMINEPKKDWVNLYSREENPISPLDPPPEYWMPKSR